MQFHQSTRSCPAVCFRLNGLGNESLGPTPVHTPPESVVGFERDKSDPALRSGDFREHS